MHHGQYSLDEQLVAQLEMQHVNAQLSIELDALADRLGTADKARCVPLVGIEMRERERTSPAGSAGEVVTRWTAVETATWDTRRLAYSASGITH